MSDNSNQPAFPHYSKVFEVSQTPGFQKNYKQITSFEIEGGLSKREVACIELGVADTGDPKLDKIILLAERKRIAAILLNGMASSAFWAENFTEYDENLSKVVSVAIKATDELLSQLSKKND